MFCYTGVTARVVGFFSLSMYYSQNIVKEFFFFLMVVLHNLLSKRTKLSKGRQSEVYSESTLRIFGKCSVI